MMTVTRSTYKKLLFVAALLVPPLFSCAISEGAKPISWQAAALDGKMLDLISDKYIQEYRFSSDGRVVATLGARDGPITAPIFYWKIENGILLIYSYSPSDFKIELGPPTKEGDILSARRETGDIVRYRLSKVDALPRLIMAILMPGVFALAASLVGFAASSRGRRTKDVMLSATWSILVGACVTTTCFYALDLALTEPPMVFWFALLAFAFWPALVFPLRRRQNPNESWI